MHQFTQNLSRLFQIMNKIIYCIIVLIVFSKCKKTDSFCLPKADFSFTIINHGKLPTTVKFTNLSQNATSYL
jgi:hypothetical protein